MSLDSQSVKDFQDESKSICEDLEEILSGLEDFDPSSKELPQEALSEFARVIDGLMGVAKTLSMEHPEQAGFEKIGSLAELCKKLGYRAAEHGVPAQIPVFAAFWADVVEMVQEYSEAIGDSEKTQAVSQTTARVLQKRLEWLLPKVTQDQHDEKQTQDDVNALLAELGM